MLTINEMEMRKNPAKTYSEMELLYLRIVEASNRGKGIRLTNRECDMFSHAFSKIYDKYGDFVIPVEDGFIYL